jgi:proline iminopeptidase
MKKIVIALLVIAMILLMVAAYFWYIMGKPLYQPGMVRDGDNLRAPLIPPEQTGDAHYWTVEPDIQLWHFPQGEGKNVLIVHGGPGYPTTQPWSGLEPLTGKYQFHYYDQRGCGQSTRPIDRFTSSNYYENMVTLDRTLGVGAQLADIERIRRILGDEKLILIGHSWGGFLAALYAAEFPDRVEALILVSPAEMLVMPIKDGGLFEAVRARLPEDMQAEYDAYIKNYLNFKDLFSQSEAGLIALNQEFARYYQAAIGKSFPEQGEPGGWMVFAQYIGLGQRHDYREALKSVAAPVLVVHGADDLQTEAATRIYVEAFPHASYRVVENAGHFAFDEQPEAFAALVDEFLAALK